MTSSQSRLPLAVRSFPLFSFFYSFDWIVFSYPRVSFIQSNLLSSRSQTVLQCFVKGQFAFQRFVRRNAWQEEGGQNNGFRDNWSFPKRVLSGNGVGGVRGLWDLYGTVLCQMLFVRLLMVQWSQWVWLIMRVRSSLSRLKCIFKHTLDCCNHSAATFTLHDLQVAYIHTKKKSK